MSKRRIISLLVCISMLLTSCANGLDYGSEQIDSEYESMEKEPILSYQVPLGQPHILVNQVGYEKESVKTVIFVGEELPQSFSVIDTESLEVKYTGTLRDKGSSEDGLTYYGYGDFSDLTTQGEYYIQCDIWGRSYSFEIKESVYKPLMDNTLAFLEQNQLDKKINALIPDGDGMDKILQGGWFTDSLNNQELETASKAFMSIMMAWELYPDALRDEKAGTMPLIIEIIEDQAAWMLQLQDEKSGGVYGGVLTNGKSNGIAEYKLIPITTESTAKFAAAMAAFSYLYQEFDKEYADLCLKAANRAWEYLLQKGLDNTPELFCAAAELYRASGRLQYHNAILSYLEAKGTISVNSEWELLGGITYLATKMKVNTQICADLMKKIMEEAELISSDARGEFLLTQGNKELDNTDEILWNMVILGISDYVITNHEYATVIENHNHFFLGRNEHALSLLQAEGYDKLAEEDKLIDNNLLYNAYYLFMLSQIMKKE